MSQLLRERVTSPPAAARTGGVNVCGYLRTENGLGAAVRGYVRALRAAEVPVALADVSDLSGNRAGDDTLAGSAGEYPHDVNLVCGDVEQHFAIRARLGEGFFRGRYNVGLWAWELPHFPERWYDRFAHYDEIWVASSFIANALSPVCPVPVVRVPPALTLESPGDRDRGRARLGVADEFVFLFVFDFWSRTARKNPLAVVEAFRRAFSPADPARLVLKCINPGFEKAAFDAMTDRARGYPVSIHTEYWTGAEVRDLTAACDAYVSLHRSEGVGLTVTDAMALGKPVIATGWSGTADFLTVGTGYPVRYDLVPVAERSGPYRKGGVWAEPSVEHAAELMRRVFENRVEAAALGRAARREIEEHYSEAAVGRLVRQRLDLIAARHRFAGLKRDLRTEPADLDAFLHEYRDLGPLVPAGHLLYRLLLRRLLDALARVIPPGATVLVVSRGDDELLRLAGRRAWHFPRDPDGRYAGHHPANGAEAVARLDELRAAGAGYLVIPEPSLWWLDHYPEFRRHLAEQGREVFRQEGTGVIYALTEGG
ncbi:MAG TPA: glycosyltransferase [Gemmataceae bacterium]|nr:glycosyltransferase [Gemmataceae bacterium]